MGEDWKDVLAKARETAPADEKLQEKLDEDARIRKYDEEIDRRDQTRRALRPDSRLAQASQGLRNAEQGAEHLLSKLVESNDFLNALAFSIDVHHGEMGRNVRVWAHVLTPDQIRRFWRETPGTKPNYFFPVVKKIHSIQTEIEYEHERGGRIDEHLRTKATLIEAGFSKNDTFLPQRAAVEKRLEGAYKEGHVGEIVDYFRLLADARLVYPDINLQQYQGQGRTTKLAQAARIITEELYAPERTFFNAEVFLREIKQADPSARVFLNNTLVYELEERAADDLADDAKRGIDDFIKVDRGRLVDYLTLFTEKLANAKAFLSVLRSNGQDGPSMYKKISLADLERKTRR